MEDNVDPIELGFPKNLEGVRLRPGMVFGGALPDSAGWALLYYVTFLIQPKSGLDLRQIRAAITLHEDGSLSATGLPFSLNVEALRGPCPVHQQLGTVFGHCFGGFHAINGVSEYFDATISENGKSFSIRYRHGNLTQPLTEISPEFGDGIRIHCKPDPEMFQENLIFNTPHILAEFRALAAQFPGLLIDFEDERSPTPSRNIIHYPNGALDYLGAQLLPRVTYTSIFQACVEQAQSDAFKFNLAAAFTDNVQTNITFIAGAYIADQGGKSQELALRGMTLALSQKLATELQINDLRSGLSAVMTLSGNVRFDCQHRRRLVGPNPSRSAMRSRGLLATTWKPIPKAPL